MWLRNVPSIDIVNGPLAASPYRNVASCVLSRKDSFDGAMNVFLGGEHSPRLSRIARERASYCLFASNA
jgi:hypothetical protein